MEKPVISVIVPVYNTEKYLVDCIESILGQTFKNLELILIDDGSIDNGGKICDDYAKIDDRIIVVHQKNGGLSDARNKGIDLACGEYITFIDSDDIISHDCLLNLVRIMRKENSDIVQCGFISFKDGEKKCITYSQKQLNYYNLTGKEACLKRYDDTNEIVVNAWGKLYKKELFQDIRFPIGKIHEDQFIIPKIMYAAKKVSILDEKSYYYRIREGSITADKFRLEKYNNIEGMNEFISFLKDNKETKLLSMAKRHRSKILALYTIQAKIEGIKNVPSECRMNLVHAFFIMRKYYTNDKYSWYLSKVYPFLVKPHEYIKKIESMFNN